MYVNQIKSNILSDINPIVNVCIIDVFMWLFMINYVHETMKFKKKILYCTPCLTTN